MRTMITTVGKWEEEGELKVTLLQVEFEASLGYRRRVLTTTNIKSTILEFCVLKNMTDLRG